MPGEINGNNAVKVGEASGQRKGPGIESIASYIWCAIYHVLMLHENKPYTPEFALPLVSLKDRINEIKERSSSTKNSAIMEFLLPIAQNNKLHEELEILNNLALNSIDYEGFYSQLSKVVTDFKLQSLADKIRLLGLLQEGKDFADVQRVYRNKWSLYNLMNDGDFKQTYINKVIGELDESVGKGFREDISKYVQLVDEGKEIASKYFGEKASLQAYCKETKEANKALNINLIHYDKSKPIKISDILQQEKDIGKLNIYCNKKRDICARRKDKKRYYEFKEGVCYQMTSKWPVEDESGNISTCTMVMNVDSTGITEIVEFESPSKEFLELIEQNKELYIQGSSLRKAVGKFLGMQQSREEMIRIEEGEECDSAPPLHNVVSTTNQDAGSSSSSTSRNASTPAKDTIQRPVIHRETDLQQQKIDKLVQDNQELRNRLNEVNSMMGGLMQNFENIKSNKSKRSIELYNEVAKLKESYEEFNEEMSRIQSKVRKIWHLLPKEERSYEHRIRGGRCYSLCNSSTELSSSEESEGYGSEMTHL